MEAPPAATRRHRRVLLGLGHQGEAPNSGFYGLDDSTCTLKLVAGKNGKIVTATILQDMPGRTSTSRCLEVFKTA